MNGTLITVDGRPAVRFVRQLDHPVERVWRAVSEPAELAEWFVATVDWTPAVGEMFDAMGQRVEVLVVDPPRLLAWTWGSERYSFELEPGDAGCRLTFTHVFEQRDRAPDFASGWDLHFNRLDAHLDGGPVPAHDELMEKAEPLMERYAEHFEIDPSASREQFRQYREQQG